MANVIDWLDIKRQYVLGYLDDKGCHQYYTLDELSERYGVSRSAIGDHASTESWVDEREALQLRIYQKAVESFEEEFYLILARGDKNAAKFAAEMLEFRYRQFRAASDEEKKMMFKQDARPAREWVAIIHETVGIEQLLENYDEEVA